MMPLDPALSQLAFERYEALYEETLYKVKAVAMFASEHEQRARRAVYEAIIAECRSLNGTAQQVPATARPGLDTELNRSAASATPAAAAPTSDTPLCDVEIKRSSALGAREGMEGAWLHMCYHAKDLELAANQMREALQPFANFSAGYGPHAREDGWVLVKSGTGKREITMGDVREALASVAKFDALKEGSHAKR